MNITLNKTDSVNTTITLEIEKADYANEVKSALKELQKKTDLPGFRKGQIPVSFLSQKYGKSILAEELNKLVSKSLTDYIQDNKLLLLGEPLSAEEQPPIDFDKQENFTFIFDVGLPPEIDIKLTKDDRLPYYQIQVTEEMIDKQIEGFRVRFGSNELAEEVEEKDLVKGKLIELDENGEPKEKGIVLDNAVLMPAYLKNEEEKAKFTGLKLQSTIVFNPYTAYDGTEAELASFLKIKKEEVKNYTGNFSFEINEISRYKEAEINQELFDKVYGTETVNSEEAFREKIKEDLTLQLAPQSDFKFFFDARKLLDEKSSDAQFPDAFLKRWLLASNPKNTPESIEKEFPAIIKELKFHTIRERLIEEYEITIDDGDLRDYAKRATRSQLAQYGIYGTADDVLDKHAGEMLKNQDSYKALGDRIFEDKLLKILKEQVTLEPQEISVEEFQKLLSENAN